ncbi:MAG: glycoside hydrolase family 13 protein [Sporolactobacillus sp.]
MEKAAVYHQPCSAYAYAYDSDTLHLKIRTKRGEMDSATLIYGDPFENVKVGKKAYEPVLKKIKMKRIAQTEWHDYWFSSVKPPFHRLQYGFVLATDDRETAFYGDRGFSGADETEVTLQDFFKFPYLHEIDRFKAPDWVKSTIWYQIFPERFANGDPSLSPKNALPWGSKDPDRDDYFGGDLQGILDHLDYLEELGINGLYLNPIFTAPTNHKYDTTDYFSIDPHFGDQKTFRKLVNEAHRRGIRIMLDAVFNHIGSTSEQWRDVVKNGENSRYKDWFHIRSFPVAEGENGNIEGQTTLSYDTFAFTPKMPKLNTANPEVCQYLLAIATYWIREFDIDGWRLDVANEVDHAFWKKFHQAVTAEKKDIYIVGEVWHNAWNWLQGDQFHSVMNYPLTQSIIDFFLKDKINAADMITTINDHYMSYMQTTNEVAFNLLDSHDTARILSEAGGDKEKVKQALVFLFSQTGSISLYYGTEIGMDGSGDPLCRKCMIWDKDQQDLDMLAFMKKLIRFRKTHQQLMTFGSLVWIEENEKTDLLHFKRSLGSETLVFLFNRGDRLQSLEMNRPTLDVWSGKTNAAGYLNVGPRQFCILQSKN